MTEHKRDKKIHVVMFLDLICEWCCLGKYILDSLRNHYELDMEYLFMEIHPDAPLYGMPMNWHLEDPSSFYKQLNAIGEPCGIHFFERDVFSNTHSALRVAEYAVAQGKGEVFLQKIWNQYMFQGKNISDPDVIMEAILQAGLPPKSLDLALTDATWEKKLLHHAKMNDLAGFNGNVPGFIVNGKYTVSGAQTADNWQDIFELCLQDNS